MEFNNLGVNKITKYCVDIVMCIDATGSMEHIIDEVKANALSFHDKFKEKMDEALKVVDKVRVKVIAFRDYAVDSEPMLVSKFFTLPEENEQFKNFVEGIEAIGGGDLPENGLEALALALKSDWTKDGDIRRHIVIMYTDAEAKPLGVDNPTLENGETLPKSFGELQELWEGQSSIMERRAKRILLFAPDVEPWNNFVTWSFVEHTASEAGKGLTEIDMSQCIDLLVKSV